jgi:hypothetical protein
MVLNCGDGHGDVLFEGLVARYDCGDIGFVRRQVSHEIR